MEKYKPDKILLIFILAGEKLYVNKFFDYKSSD